ncbi:MAG: hypothetical protein AAGF47_05555 [Planctomycetota bacterium]
MDIATVCADFDGQVWQDHADVGIRERFAVRPTNTGEIRITLQLDGLPEDDTECVVVRLVAGCASVECPPLCTGFSDAALRLSALLAVAARLMDQLEGNR